ncbi:MAG TPA: glycine cleavage T C-terminal barrel domain-containing protein, partial [Anaerolineae bacterium]|nr:glycine cleavage T C-terminal barrel domain-containing protein [Anaerolineae bacterium]
TNRDGMLSLYGERTLDLLQPLTGANLSSLPLHHWLSTTLKDIEILIARADPIGGGGFHLMMSANSLPVLRSVLIESGAMPIADETYQILRVEAGQPEFGHELIDSTIPLEANLWADVSFTKGCYTGQEIIARMESRQQLAKQLIGLRLLNGVPLPANILLAGSDVGNVTSVVHSPAHGWLGLGYCKPAAAVEDQSVQLQTGTQLLDAHISLLPFKF